MSTDLAPIRPRRNSDILMKFWSFIQECTICRKIKYLYMYKKLLTQLSWQLMFPLKKPLMNLSSQNHYLGPLKKNCGFNSIKRRADSRLVPSQWETSLQSNAVSHWLGTNLESTLKPSAFSYVVNAFIFTPHMSCMWCLISRITAVL